MRRNHPIIFAIITILAAVAAPRASMAQSHPEFVPLGRLSAAVYKPDSGPSPHVAFVIAHRTANYLNHIGCGELSRRGFMVVCFNTRFENNEAQFPDRSAVPNLRSDRHICRQTSARL